MTNATATYEETAIVTTYTYTATVVTEQGETTATLIARQDLDCPRRREIKCANCSCWYTLYYNINLQAYEPVHCNNCCIGLYDIHFVPAPVVTEPVVEETAELTVEAVAAGISHYKSVLAAWDAACEEPTVEQVAAQVDAAIAVVDAATQAYPGQCDDCPGRSHPLCCWSTEDKKPAIYTHMLIPGEHRNFVHMTAEVDEPQFGLKAEQAYYLVRSESMSRTNEQPTYWLVVWSYEECRWVCPCPDKRHHQCKHVRLVNQDCKARAQQSTVEQQEAA